MGSFIVEIRWLMTSKSHPNNLTSTEHNCFIALLHIAFCFGGWVCIDLEELNHTVNFMFRWLLQRWDLIGPVLGANFELFATQVDFSSRFIDWVFAPTFGDLALNHPHTFKQISTLTFPVILLVIFVVLIQLRHCSMWTHFITELDTLGIKSHFLLGLSKMHKFCYSPMHFSCSLPYFFIGSSVLLHVNRTCFTLHILGFLTSELWLTRRWIFTCRNIYEGFRCEN